RSTVCTCADYSDAIENAVIVLAMCFERFDHQPLIGMSRADLAPSHATTLTSSCDSDQVSRRRRAENGGLDEGYQTAGKTSSIIESKRRECLAKNSGGGGSRRMARGSKNNFVDDALQTFRQDRLRRSPARCS